jgi:hypothetical protein
MSASTNRLSHLEGTVPGPLKSRAKEAMLNRTFRRAVTRITNLPLGEVPDREVLGNLQQGWGNEGFAAQIEYLEEVGRQAASTAGPILECGSGLTTVLMGLLAGRRGVETWSLEHIRDWRARVVRTLDQFGISHTKVCEVELRTFDGFDWYDAPLAQLPKEFKLVICDGPPGETLGRTIRPATGHGSAAERRFDLFSLTTRIAAERPR